jgi:hypothetical protein
METFRLGNVAVLHRINEKVFELAKPQIIPLHIWILLKFKKTIINSDAEIHNGTEYKTVIYAKSLFGHLYIMKEEKYINGKLVARGKLHRIENGIRGLSAKMWNDELPNLQTNQDQCQ